MKYPVIAPTGALASGAYTDYMITYTSSLADYVKQQLEGCYPQDTIDEWGTLWDRTISDVQAEVTELTAQVSDIQAKLIVIQNSI